MKRANAVLPAEEILSAFRVFRLCTQGEDKAYARLPEIKKIQLQKLL